MNKIMNYIYVAVLEFTEKHILITFPDLPEALSQADTWDQCYTRAADVLKLTIESHLEDGKELPTSTPLNEIKLSKNQCTTIVSYVKTGKVKYVKKTLTIPEDLNVAAERAGINFSQLLQKSIQDKLLE